MNGSEWLWIVVNGCEWMVLNTYDGRIIDTLLPTTMMVVDSVPRHVLGMYRGMFCGMGRGMWMFVDVCGWLWMVVDNL